MKMQENAAARETLKTQLAAALKPKQIAADSYLVDQVLSAGSAKFLWLFAIIHPNRQSYTIIVAQRVLAIDDTI